MKPSRIILLVVALVAGLLAAYLVMRGGDSEPVVVTDVVQETRSQILVATAPIGVGERLSPTTVTWQDWPEGAVRPEYVNIATSPNALEEITGSVARFEFFAGEPIRSEKLVHSDQGYLSAVLEEGMRGVSINVTAASGAGGFIIPNDRVDVVVTVPMDGREVSKTIIENVKVLAIGTRLGEVGTTGGAPDPANPQSQVFTDATIATLELDPVQAEVVINAAAVGEISLALRSVVDFNAPTTDVRNNGTNQPIRVIRAGEEASIVASSMQQQQPQTPAPVTPEVSVTSTTPAESQPIVPSNPPSLPAPAVQLQ
jgi:pilus assembly protein CpaB